VHPSNEMYGADKVLLELVDALPADYEANVWLPLDVHYAGDELRLELAKRKIDVHFVDLPVLRRSYMNLPGLLALLPRFFKTARRLRMERFELLYINTSALALLAPLSRLLGRPAVVHLHEYLAGVTRRILQLPLSCASEIVCVSEAVRDALPGSVKLKSKVVYNGFDLLPAGTQPSAGKLVFVLASRWNTWKGHQTLLEAWGNLRRQDVELRIYGGPPEIGGSVDVVGMVSELPNRESVRICGQVRDISDALRGCHVVLVPSTNPDPLPTIALEAAASGRAVVASRSGGLTEIVSDGETGWLVSPGIPREWTERIESLSIAEVLAAGRKARSRFDGRFNQAAFAKNMGAIYEKYASR
jgi:glycosyltransferase involved in cell wall biosynthesis